jgi:GrpB-like predicted nucleotidyltransferase (UPF0157 family)/predicted N-acetyltransferase YhbS
VSISIRRARRDDDAAIAAVHVQSVRRWCHLHYTEDEREGWVGAIESGSHVSHIDTLDVFVAEDDDRHDIVGFGILDRRSSEVRAVFAGDARRGVGGALLRCLEAEAVAKGCTSLALRSSLNAVEFYWKAGYVPGPDEFHQTSSGVRLRCVRMTKRLVSGAAEAPPPEMPIVLVPHDLAWAERFEAERVELLRALRRHVTSVEHIGSTAIPHIDAKPLIDVAVVVPRIAIAPYLFSSLESLGYHYFPYDEDRTPERRWFCKPNRLARTHHLHLVEDGSPWLRGALAFRDRLRADPVRAGEYQALKRSLAARFAGDREAYTEGKSDFIAAVIRGAGSAPEAAPSRR